MVLDLNDGDRWPLVDFIPSEPLATAFQFFDQFAYSHSPWSPDSGSLVFAGTLAGGATSASFGRQPEPGIFVVGVGTEPTVERVAGGVMAVWSPRSSGQPYSLAGAMAPFKMPIRGAAF